MFVKGQTPEESLLHRNNGVTKAEAPGTYKTLHIHTEDTLHNDYVGTLQHPVPAHIKLESGLWKKPTAVRCERRSRGPYRPLLNQGQWERPEDERTHTTSHIFSGEERWSDVGFSLSSLHTSAFLQDIIPTGRAREAVILLLDLDQMSECWRDSYGWHWVVIIDSWWLQNILYWTCNVFGSTVHRKSPLALDEQHWKTVGGK